MAEAVPVEFFIDHGSNTSHLRAMVGNRVTDPLFSLLHKESESAEDVGVRLVQGFFDITDLASGDELSDLRQEFLRHTHGQAEI